MSDRDIQMGFPMLVGIVVTSAAQLASVYALLGGASAVAVTATVPLGKVTESVKPSPAAPPIVEATGETTPSTPTAASPSDEEIDAAGWPWSAELHASTKGTTKDGLWRMKIGVTRPDPKPGFPKSTGTEASGTAPQSSPSATETIAEDDEFAAFRVAAAKSDAEDAAAKASVPARKWTDADLGALCNQAAVKLGDPSPVKEIIAKFIPEGTVAHSRNIPEDQRENFAKAVEEKVGIEFAG